MPGMFTAWPSAGRRVWHGLDFYGRAHACLCAAIWFLEMLRQLRSASP
jgi:hypothetical protein